jgi:hypothetical protein
MINEKIIFTEDECKWILSFSSTKTWSDRDNLVLEYTPDWGGDTIRVNVPKTRSYCSEIIFNKNDDGIEDLFNFLIKKLEFFNINNINTLNFIKYDMGSFMARHRDTGGGYNMDSTLKSVTIQLSDKSDYTGGDLIIDDVSASKELGNVIMFDSQRFHEITKIESGCRISLVLFLERGDFFDKNKRII